MPQTKGQTSQDVNDAGLKNLGTQPRDSVASLFDKINKNLDSPLRMAASYPTADAKLNFLASNVTQADGAALAAPVIKSQVFNIAVSTIDFQTHATTGATFLNSWPTSTLDYYRRVGFTLLSSGSIQMLWSAEVINQGSLANAGTLFVKSGLAIGYIDLKCTDITGKFKTAASATSIIENSGITRFGAGSGSGSGSSSASSSGGGELADLMYNAKVMDMFSDLPDGTTTVDIAAGKTDPSLYDSSNNLFRIGYDANKTVTGTGANMTLSGAPAFTVKIGDVLIYNSEVRKISTVTSQTVYVLESAFSSNPTTGACCVSQAVHTVDLNNFTNNGQVQSVASQYSGNVDEIMMGYWESSSLGDIIPDFGTAPVIGFSASTDASSWTTARVRQTSLSSSETPVTCSTSNPNLYLRFFANKTSGSGAVNLLRYKVFFQKIVGQTVGSNYYTAYARPTVSIAQNCSIGLVSGKTRFKFSFPYTRGLNAGEASGSILTVEVNGQAVPRRVVGITDDTQAYFTEIDDSTIEMDTDYSSAGIDFQFTVQRIGVIDTNSLNTPKIALHDDLLDQSLDAQVIPSWLTAINGAPSGGQFRSDITGRANIPDLSSMLSVQMGPQRMMTQEIYQLQNEFGPTGQPVFGVVNDKFNQVRFVGGWASSNDSNGQRQITSTATDYVEIVFYGTGLNLLAPNSSISAIDFRASVDGGSFGSNLLPTTPSTILNARNYSTNMILPIVSGLSLGTHTIKVQLYSNGLVLTGFEVLTETTSLRVTPGTIAKGKYKNTLSSLQTVAYDSNFESGTLGNRGGCVLVYLKNDGTIGKAITPTDTTTLYLTNASHVNEEIVRVHNWKEFGCGRADDFSLTFTAQARAFTLDDGTTTLVTSAGTANYNPDTLTIASNAAFITLTFIGTGLDIIQYDIGSGGADSYNIQVDGGSTQALPSAGVASAHQVKICSGLPYGTHTVRINRVTSATWSLGVQSFIIYAPKKPALPVGAIELAQYYKVADYVLTSNAGVGYIANGVLRKEISTREAIYTGTWSAISVSPALFDGGWDNHTLTSGSTVSYSFWGTGFEWKTHCDAVAQNATLSVDGSTNLSSFTTSLLQTGSGVTFTASTGVLAGTSTSQSIRVQVSGLTLGWHTMKWTTNSAAAFYAGDLDVITPIHAPTINGPYVLQNTLALGNNGFLDLRKFNKRDIVLSALNKSCQCFGVTSSPTMTGSNYTPLNDMSTTHFNSTGKIRVSYSVTMNNTLAAVSVFASIFVDGVPLLIEENIASPAAGYTVLLSNVRVINVAPGYHKIDIYWKCSNGTTTALAANRMLTVEESL